MRSPELLAAGALIAPPAAVGRDTFNNDNLRAFDERQRFTLIAALARQAGATYLAPGAVGLGTRQDTASFSGNTVSFRLTASSPGDTVRVITAAPEASTWAMMLFGFGMISTTLRLRHHAATA